MKVFLKIALSAYRMFLSPALTVMGARCRYHPCCSEYAQTAVDKKPLGRAMWLITRRLLRCGPWSVGGVDFVPGVRDQ
ncbi:MAG: membrane protein insertion efficiency factor YidD [Pseudomonadota bacterium]